MAGVAWASLGRLFLEVDGLVRVLRVVARGGDGAPLHAQEVEARAQTAAPAPAGR